jgi:phosphoribosylglycinamide formyltransferase-1
MRLAVLLSGTGRTLDNFHKRITDGTMQGSIEVVLSNQQDALGLEKAKQYGYPAFHASNNEAINEIIDRYRVDLVVLAGFLKLYTPPDRLKKSVLNIHPSLIPSFCGAGYYGMKVHNAVYKRGVKITGCTVHFANEVYDEGPIVVQKPVKISEDDTPNDIAAKVFAAECLAYPEAINLVAEKGVDYFWNISRS